MVARQQHPHSAEGLQRDLETPQGIVIDRNLVERVASDEHGIHAMIAGERRDPFQRLESGVAKLRREFDRELPEWFSNLKVGRM
jgi:hypothetical protein